MQGIRSFPHAVPIPYHNATARCLKSPSYNSSFSAPPPHHQRRQAHGPHGIANLSAPLIGELRRVLVYVHNVDIFPWLWDSVLNAGTTDEQGNSGSYSPRVLREPGKYMPIKRKAMAGENLEFVLVEGDPLLAMQTHGVSDIVVVAWEMPTSFLKSLPAHTHVGLVVASYENCNNPPLDPRVKFALLTYGDCALVDHGKNEIWPLGPRTSDGFPSKYEDHKPSSQREYTLNLAATYNTAKPTRMQAWLMATEACQYRTCAITWTNPATRIIEVFDKMLGTTLTDWTRDSDIQEYIKLLSDSKFTLCPAGKNPEQYRIYEAIMAGSIPIIEDHYIPPGSLHPAFESNWRCIDEDRHYWLKKTKAPVIFVENWHELPALLNLMDEESIDRMQADLIIWFAEFQTEMKALFLRQVREYL